MEEIALVLSILVYIWSRILTIRERAIQSCGLLENALAQQDTDHSDYVRLPPNKKVLPRRPRPEIFTLAPAREERPKPPGRHSPRADPKTEYLAT
ncbi:hypothetical protein BDW67DRAFT_141721 [Aspergillus spinulosporus]